MEEKKKRTLLIVSLAIVLALVFGISYAYFLAQDESGTQTITTQNIGVKLDDGTEKEPVLLAEDIKPIDRVDIQTKAVKKNFTVTNTGDEKLFVEISLDDIVLGTDNALQRYDYLWSLYEVVDGTEKNISIGAFEYVEDTVTVGQYLVFEPDDEKEYNLYIWIEETNLNQNAMMGQEFTAKVVATGEVYWESPASDFTFDKTTGTITKYNGESKEVSIPSVIDDTAVTEIGDGAFCANFDSIVGCLEGMGITNIIIPNSINKIGKEVCSSNNITSIVIPNSVTEILEYAFYDNSITNIIIPNSVTKIGSGVFSSNNITSIVIPNSITEILGYTFYGNSITNLIIPNSVTSIGGYAFDETNLEEIIVEGKSSLSEFTNSAGLSGFEDIITFKP